MTETDSSRSVEAGGASPAPKLRIGDRFRGPLDALHILREVDPTKADATLESLASGDSVEQEILDELREARSLADPDGFMQAHRTFVRAVEIYDRNARRAPKGLGVGILRPIATPLVALMVRSITLSYQRRVVTEVRKLYAMREANSKLGTPRHRMLVVARRQLDAIAPDLAGRGLVIPAFLLGGAVVSTIASFLNALLRDDIGRLALLVGVALITIGAFWCILTAAAITRRRTRLVLDLPLQELFATIGSAGRPPRDPSRVFVAAAAVLLVIGWIIAPLIATIFYSLT